MDHTFKLVSNYRRPVISLQKYHGIYALIDTGARFPVWTLFEDELVSIGGIRQNIKVRFGGFGGQTMGELFTIDLWMDESSVLLKDLPIVANSDVNIRCPIILSATCFEGMIYEVNTLGSYFRISSPGQGIYVKKFGYKIIENDTLDVFVQE